MAHWMRLYGNRILNLRYEAMVRDPEGARARLFEHCGLDCDAPALIKDLRSDQIDKWKHYEPYLGPMILKLARFNDHD